MSVINCPTRRNISKDNPPRATRPLFKLTALATIFFLCLILLELGTRSIDATRGHEFFNTGRNEIASPPRISIPFRNFGRDLYVESDGAPMLRAIHGELYPLAKPGNTYRIVFFGGSTTLNQQVFNSHGIHYPLLVERELRERTQRKSIEVINASYSAYSTAHSLSLLTLDVLSWNADLVLMSHNINDLSAAYFPDFRLDYANKYRHQFFQADNRQVFTPGNALFQWSNLWWVLRSLSRTALASSREQLKTTIQRRSYGKSAPVTARAVFKRNLMTFVRVATDAGIQVALATQPLQPSEEKFIATFERKSYNDIVKYPLHSEFVAHHRGYNETIKEVAVQENVLLIDNAKALGTEMKSFSDSIHYNLAGVERLASHVTATLLSSVPALRPPTE